MRILFRTVPRLGRHPTVTDTSRSDRAIRPSFPLGFPVSGLESFWQRIAETAQDKVSLP